MHQQGGTLAATDITIHRGADAILERVSLAVTPGAGSASSGRTAAARRRSCARSPGSSRSTAAPITRNPPSLRVGYLPQERDLAPEETLASYLARRTGVGEAEAKLAALEARARKRPARRRGRTPRRSSASSPSAAPTSKRVPAECSRTSASTRRSTGPAGALSGGEQGRAALASILLARFDVFLLDEPTNDLDFAGLDLLERFLLAVEGGVVLVSHDRALLDRTVNRIVELESGTQRVHHYAGGWSEFEAARERGRAGHERAFAHWSEGARALHAAPPGPSRAGTAWAASRQTAAGRMPSCRKRARRRAESSGSSATGSRSPGSPGSSSSTWPRRGARGDLVVLLSIAPSSSAARSASGRST